MRSLSAIAFAVVGVLVLVGALRLLQVALAVSVGGLGPTPHGVLIVLWLSFAATVCIGFWLILKRRWLATRLFDDSSSEIAIEPRIALRLTLVIIGVAFIASAVPGLLGAVASGVVESSGGSDGFTTTSVSWDWVTIVLSAVYPFAQLVVGGLLLAFSERLAHRLWPGGSSAPAAMSHELETASGPADSQIDASS